MVSREYLSLLQYRVWPLGWMTLQKTLHVILPFYWLKVEWCLCLYSDAHRTSGPIFHIRNFMKKEKICPACCQVACNFPQITYLSLHWLAVRYWMCNLREQSVQQRNLTGREKVSQQERTSASGAKRKHWTVVRSAKIPRPIVLNMDAHKCTQLSRIRENMTWPRFSFAYRCAGVRG